MPLYFDVTDSLAYNHDCECCHLYPLEDKDERCLLCGYTQNEIDDIHYRCDEMNEAYNKHSDKKPNSRPRQRSRNAFLHLHNVNIGGDEMDYLTFADIDQNDDIRELADLVDHMVEVIIIPTEVVHKNIYDDEDDWHEG